MGGRQKGTPNKSTAAVREAIAAQWTRYQETGQFEKDINALDPQARAIIMEKYASYIAPKLKSVDNDITHNIRMTIEDRLNDLVNRQEEDDDEEE